MFELSLVESNGRPHGGKSWLSLPVSLMIHAGVVGTALAASAWHVDDVPEPPTPAIFFTLGPTGPLAQRHSGPPPALMQNPPPAPPNRVTQPAPPSDLSDRAAAVPPDPAANAGGAAPGEEGDSRGFPGGFTGESEAAGTVGQSSGPSEEIIFPGGEVSEPLEIFRVQPDYPEAARRAHMEGVVVLQAVITRSGTVDSVRLVRGLNPLLDRAAMDAVVRWRYSPATYRGNPVPVFLTVTVTFQLQRG